MYSHLDIDRAGKVGYHIQMWAAECGSFFLCLITYSFESPRNTIYSRIICCMARFVVL